MKSFATLLSVQSFRLLCAVIHRTLMFDVFDWFKTKLKLWEVNTAFVLGESIIKLPTLNKLCRKSKPDRYIFRNITLPKMIRSFTLPYPQTLPTDMDDKKTRALNIVSLPRYHLNQRVVELSRVTVLLGFFRS